MHQSPRHRFLRGRFKRMFVTSFKDKNDKTTRLRIAAEILKITKKLIPKQQKIAISKF